MGRRIGFLLANVYQGSSLAMWHSIAKEAKREKDSTLFVFPGGRLRYAHDNEYLRNSIYDLANGSSLDGAIIWASTLSGEVDAAEAEAFALEKSQEMPVVAIGTTIDGCPSVNFDAYTGMKDEIVHLIKVHNDRKIAFIRGPVSHKSAEQRIRAYKDALSENGIEYDGNLISSPRAWGDGRSAIVELIEERGLVPGRDFTALVAASDLLLLAAVRYLANAGISIPYDIHVAGFNDNQENMLMTVEPTTVRMPIERIASSAYTLLSSMKRGDTRPSILLPADLIIRHSCGCEGFGIGPSDAAFMEYAERKSGKDASKPAFRALVSYLKGEGDDAFLSSQCNAFVSSGGDSEAMFEIVSSLDDIDSDRRSRLFQRLVTEERMMRALEKQRTRDLTSALDSFKTKLLAARSLQSLPSIMQESFGKLGIGKCFLMLYKDFSTTELAGGFSGDTLLPSPIPFPRSCIVPEELEGEVKDGTFVIEPLFFDSQEMGYIMIGTDWCEGYVLEDIRTSLSSALKGISLLEEANDAKERAERGEREAEEFYAKISEGLMQPLSDAKTMILRKGRTDKEGIIRSLTGAEHLLELAMAERGELGLVRTFVPMHSLLPSISEFASPESPQLLPLMEIDRDRFLEALGIFSSLVSADRAVIRIEEGEAGLLFSITGNGGERDETAHQLAECIIVLHSGTVAWQGDSVNVFMPYPVLSEGRRTGHGVVFVGNADEKPDGLAADAVSPKEISSLNARTVALLSSDKAAAAAVLPEAEKKGFSIMLFSDAEDISLRAAFESAAAEKRSILVFGNISMLPSQISEVGNVTDDGDDESVLDSKEQYDLIIMTDCNADFVRRIRKRSRFSSLPILIVSDVFEEKGVSSISDLPNVIIANTAILESPDFLAHLASIASGGQILPPLTGIIVKKAIVYLNSHATHYIARWQLAESINISEDYLTRVFRKEIGLSPWDYLNRYRIQIASSLLVSTAKPLSEIAEESGFQDQAYFCRVFKKIKGFSPGQMRTR